VFSPSNFTVSWPEGKTIAPSDRSVLAGRTLRCLTKVAAPFVIASPSSSPGGPPILSGVAIDAAATMAANLGIRITYTITNATYNSIVADVGAGAFDCAVADISITTARLQIAAFSLPYFSDAVQLAVRKPTVTAAGLFSFLAPFSMTLWITYFVLALVCGVLFFIFEHKSNEDLELASGVSFVATSIFVF